MEINFYIWLMLTIAITALVWVGIVKTLNNKQAEEVSAGE